MLMIINITRGSNSYIRDIIYQFDTYEEHMRR